MRVAFTLLGVRAGPAAVSWFSDDLHGSNLATGTARLVTDAPSVEYMFAVNGARVSVAWLDFRQNRTNSATMSWLNRNESGVLCDAPAALFRATRPGTPSSDFTINRSKRWRLGGRCSRGSCRGETWPLRWWYIHVQGSAFGSGLVVALVLALVLEPVGTRSESLLKRHQLTIATVAKDSIAIFVKALK